jgi:large conductance mechanosensitive channel
MVRRSQATGFIADFQKFITQGNVVDLAVAVVIGGAFGKIVTSLIEDVITPGILTPALEAAKVKDLADLAWGTIKYGSFLAAIINFLVIAFVIFLIIRSFEKFKRKQEVVEEAAPPSTEERLVSVLERMEARM